MGLKIVDCQVSEDDLVRMMDAFTSHQLLHLKLSGLKIELKGMKAISRFVARCGLMSLSLPHNQGKMTSEVMQELNKCLTY